MMKDKVALITGGSRGIGLGIAKGFIEQGAKLAINYRHDEAQAQKALEQFGGQAIAIRGDISHQEERESLVEQVIAKFGKIDVLVNNAGIIARHGFLKGTEEEFNKIIRVNLTAPIFLAQAVAKQMIKQGHGGSIINISSISAHLASHTCSYGVAKAGLIQATKAMAYKLAQYNIRVNSISPGFFMTDLNSRVWRDDPAAMERYEKNIPLKRAAKTSEMVGTAVYLASELSSYTTGTDILVDGGAVLK